MGVTSSPRGSPCFQVGESPPWPKGSYFQGISPFIVPRMVPFSQCFCSCFILDFAQKSSKSYHQYRAHIPCNHLRSVFQWNHHTFNLLRSYWVPSTQHSAECRLSSSQTCPRRRGQGDPACQRQNRVQPCAVTLPQPVGLDSKFGARVSCFKITAWAAQLSV